MHPTLSPTARVLLFAGVVIVLLTAEANAYVNFGFKCRKEFEEWCKQNNRDPKDGSPLPEPVPKWDRYSPKDASDYYDRGCFYSERNAHQKAVADYGKAIQLAPRFAEAYFRRGQTLWLLSKKAGGLANVERATRLDPNMVEAQVYLAAHTDDIAKGISAAKQACEQATDRQDVCLQLLASLYARGGDFESAVRWQQKALQLTAYGLEAAEERLEDYRQRRLNPRPIPWDLVK
jgi:tetratricopeptide (TPR) repeat protein